MKTTSIIRIDTFPISTNNMYAGRRMMTRVAREVKQAIAWEARAAYSGQTLQCRLRVHVKLFYRDTRRRDIDNLKMLFDALSGIVWRDDSQIDELNIRRLCDPGDPRIMVTVEKI